jgi:hypothetical protein
MRLFNWMFAHPANLFFALLCPVIMLGGPMFILWRHQALKNAVQAAPVIIEATVTPLALETLNLPSTPTATPLPANPWQPVVIGVESGGGQAAVLLFNESIPEAQIVYLTNLGDKFVTGNVMADQAVLTFASDMGQQFVGNVNAGFDYQVTVFQFTPEAATISVQTCADACFGRLAYNQVEVVTGEPTQPNPEFWSFLAQRGQTPIQVEVVSTGIQVKLISANGNMLLSTVFPDWVDTVVAGSGQWYR